MKDCFKGKGFLPLAAVVAVMCIALPIQAQVLSKASPHRMRASRSQVSAGFSAGFEKAVLFATNSIDIGDKSQVLDGDVVVNQASSGETLVSGVELNIRKEVAAGKVIAQDIAIAGGASVTAAHCESITNGTCLPITLPVYPQLPAFREVRGFGPDVTVAAGAAVTIGTGNYGVITIGNGGKLFLTGGEYSVRSIQVGDGSSLLALAPTDVRVEGKIRTVKNAKIGPAPGSGVFARHIIFYVAGINGTDGGISEKPAAVEIKDSNVIAANFYAPNGRVELAKTTQVMAGAFFARDIEIAKEVSVALDSFFSNQPPTAESQSVLTNGAASIDIILKGSDPEGGSLNFSIVTSPNPLFGNITAGPTPIVPPTPPGRCSVSGDACTVDGDCPVSQTCEPSPVAPVTMASVTYAPVNPGANEVNSFSFQVADPEGATAVAVVTIDDVNDTSPPPPPATAVSAPDISAETTTDTPVTIGLTAGACEGSVIVFRITSLPTGGTLSDGGNDIESTPHTLSGSTFVFTPNPGFTGNPTFGYSATDTGTVGACTTTVDSGIVTVNVAPAPDLAPEQMVETSLNTPIEFLLGGPNQMAPGAPLKMARVGAAPSVVNAPLPGATIAGNVYSSNGTTGTGKDDLPGPAPIFIAAAVDVATAGPTLTWTLSGVTFADGGEASGTFDYNASTETVSNWNISVSGGGGSFPALVYTPANSSGSVVCLFAPCPAEQEKSIKLDLNSSTRQLRITPLTPLTAAGGNITIDLDTGPVGNPSASIECFNCSPSRLINAGSLTATPEKSIYRIQMEWDVTALPTNAAEIEACEVTLITNKGTVDSLDTTFFAGAGNQNGTLDLTDFEAPVGVIPLAVMPASIGIGGTDVSFSFDVTGAVASARSAGFSYFSIQGQVNEDLVGGGFQRGLQIRSSASGNLMAGTEPQLVCQTGSGPPTGPQLSWQVLSLPSNGTLLDPSGAPVTAGQTFSFQPTLTFISPVAGTFSFSYKVTFGTVVDTALVTLVVGAGDVCLVDGRRVNCTQSQCSDGIDNDGDYVPPVLGPSNETVIPGSGGIDWDGVGGLFLPDPACTGPGDDDEFPVNP